MVILLSEISKMVIRVLLVDVREHMIIMKYGSKINEGSVIHKDEDGEIGDDCP